MQPNEEHLDKMCSVTFIRDHRRHTHLLVTGTMATLSSSLSVTTKVLLSNATTP